MKPEGEFIWRRREARGRAYSKATWKSSWRVVSSVLTCRFGVRLVLIEHPIAVFGESNMKFNSSYMRMLGSLIFNNL